MKKLFTLLLLAFMAVGVYAQEKVVYLGSHILNWDTTPISFSSFAENDIIIVDGSLDGGNNHQIIMRADQTNISPTFSKAKNAYQLTAENASALNSSKLNIYGTGYTNNKISIIAQQTITDTSLPFDQSSSVEESNKLQLKVDAIKDLAAGDVIGFVLDPSASAQSWAQIRLQGQSGESWTWKDFIGFTDVYQNSIYEYTVQESDVEFFSNPKAFWAIGKYIKVLAVYVLKESDTYVLSPSNNDVDVASLPNTAINVELARQFSSGWNSLCLPFNAAVSTIAADAELFEFTSATSESVTLTKKNSGEIVAGTPYLVKLSSNSSETTTFTNVSVTASTAGSTSTYGGLTFKGNYEAGFDMTDKYGVAYSSDSWYIMKGGANATGKAFSAYFEETVPSPAPTRGFNIITGDGTTKINTVEKVEEGDGEIYNLMGVRTSAPRKGLYIKNGKKYIVK